MLDLVKETAAYLRQQGIENVFEDWQGSQRKTPVRAVFVMEYPHGAPYGRGPGNGTELHNLQIRARHQTRDLALQDAAAVQALLCRHEEGLVALASATASFFSKSTIAKLAMEDDSIIMYFELVAQIPTNL